MMKKWAAIFLTSNPGIPCPEELREQVAAKMLQLRLDLARKEKYDG